MIIKMIFIGIDLHKMYNTNYEFIALPVLDISMLFCISTNRFNLTRRNVMCMCKGIYLSGDGPSIAFKFIFKTTKV